MLVCFGLCVSYFPVDQVHECGTAPINCPKLSYIKLLKINLTHFYKFFPTECVSSHQEKISNNLNHGSPMNAVTHYDIKDVTSPYLYWFNHERSAITVIQNENINQRSVHVNTNRSC